MKTNAWRKYVVDSRYPIVKEKTLSRA